ncbi:MAG: fibrobacter succinogenes major paralogous domain-containing protein [Fibrobacter sp.]|uniref:fibrobacter succinogenes major paralogous domain-containing protein n=1 Tax=Fibrobacter sp. TaxID=35828 RepID=UPI0025C3EA4A|nr:fibrobacter succinogenes major paralogous domain-containing protein [Fibrobacter sp.]MBR4783647.1 fibrobacter succinogenes major paralogous domain-containing protein [Fibrobacter sp.]
MRFYNVERRFVIFSTNDSGAVMKCFSLSRQSLFCISAVALAIVLVSCDETPEKDSSSEDSVDWSSIVDYQYDRGTLLDSRDGKIYRTVIIGNQVWMAQNLAYDEFSYCYFGDNYACDVYGNLYHWREARKACPDGWHLPSRSEFEKLIEFAGGMSQAAERLKSKYGWHENWTARHGMVEGHNGTDDFGFTALPAGFMFYGRGGGGEGLCTMFWSSTTVDSASYTKEEYAYNLDIGDSLYLGRVDKLMGLFSVRCVKGHVLDTTQEKDGIAEWEKRIEKESIVARYQSVKGTLRDSRDGKVYNTVKIGQQTWMAQNLNFETEDSFCYDESERYCTKYGYGRLYPWRIAKTVCPAGWHLPSKGEFESLLELVGEDSGAKLKSRSRWGERCWGLDVFGFNALAAGYGELTRRHSPFNAERFACQLILVMDELGDKRNKSKKDSCKALLQKELPPDDGSELEIHFYHKGSWTFFWSSVEADSDSAYAMDLAESHGHIEKHKKETFYSVRCVKDENQAE